ncbi:hypothetical protein KCH_05720 [Kitasatospora cheerisanensis KCTC 2395]|uniref:Uncharacterized protein n=1 Tax=Kitasatospora cheerisanensis KCTC 2395 TaxID=1348663 RepID=A0A066ZBH3_9ACTN|nr:hypothetical protein KCH_05720 [Kitasatospora cheerisanensis KCTC 2395]
MLEPGVPGLLTAHQQAGAPGVVATDDPCRGPLSPRRPGTGTVLPGRDGSGGPCPAPRAGARMSHHC